MNKAFVRIQCELPTLQSALWSLLAGITGTLILTGFLSGIITLTTLSSVLPLIVGFNAAISGYMLIERTGGQIKLEKTMASTMGIAVALLSCLSMNALCLRMNVLFVVSGSLVVATAIMGLIAGWSGGTLAVKYRELKEKAAIP